MTAAKAGNIPPLDPAAAEPFYRQIYDRFRDAIAREVLKPGDRIPSARALTKELGWRAALSKPPIPCWLPKGTFKPAARQEPS